MLSTINLDKLWIIMVLSTYPWIADKNISLTQSFQAGIAKRRFLQEGAEYISFTTDVWSSMTHCLDSQPIGRTISFNEDLLCCKPNSYQKDTLMNTLP